uniref:PGC-1 and ERR-induced regulator in muscle protein 1 n=1 Tax=Hippocampus comes TaxID=109280 RepID=A0A3Q2XZY1_HIPCM
MDDLDHSMRIAEEVWSNFCQESEECCVPQPLLACPEGLRCSDRSVPATQSPQSLEENRTTCVKLELIQDVIEEDTAEDNKAQICNDTGIPFLSQEVHVTEERIPEETQKSIVQTPEVNDVARSLPTERETKVRCLAQAGSEFPPREEKERWFVTLLLNDSPVSRRASATPRKKKAQLKKKWCRPRREPQHNESAVNKNINATPNQNRSEERVGQKTSCGSVQNICMETRHDGDIERNDRKRPLRGEDITQDREDGTIQDIQQNRQERTLHVDIVQSKKDETLYDGDRTTHQDDSMRQDKIEATLNGDERTQTKSKRAFCVDHTTRQDNVEERLQGDDMAQNNKEGALHDDGALQNDTEGTPHDIFHLERVDSDEFVDSVEFFTFPSSGSEIYLSASESVAQDLFEEDSVENQPREFPSYTSSSLLLLPHNCDPIQSSGARSLQAKESDDNGGGSDKVFVEPTWAFSPLTSQRGATPPAESSTHQKADLPRVQTEPHLTACGVDGPRSVPDVIITPVADGPEAYAQAAGRAPCVFAISAFWDEMEKLTINDILQLRMARSPPSTETSDVPSQSGSLVDPDELHLTDGGLTDVSDAADSDYFTQPDDSKVDRSSWDFSVCDFEDDYWQFLGMSRNASPDLSCKTQREEEEEERSTGIQTPVPVEDSARQNPMPRAMMKNKSVQNIRALNTDDLSLQSHLHNDEKKSKRDSLGSIVAAPLQGDDLEFSPESFITEETGNRNVIFVYDPEGTSHAPGYNDMICTCEHKMFLPTQSHNWKPIPIFSCSHPTVRELPLLKRNDPFFSVDFLEEDVISPVRIVSRALRVAESQSGRSLLPFGKIRFQDKGSIWYRRSDGWELPTQSEEGVRVGVLSALQQSDMCLVCIAFASWVLASSDPESADAWKAAVLANVSALSAIQYLRQTK